MSHSFLMEEKKYEFFMPSYEAVLSLFFERERSASCEELAKELGINSENQIAGLHRRLHSMECTGQLIVTSQKRYVLSDTVELLKGTVIGHRDGSGFFRVEGRKEDYYLSVAQMQSVIHGDTVIAELKNDYCKGRREVHIVRVLAQKNSLIIGRLCISKNGDFFVKPNDNHFNFNILIPPAAKKGADVGFIVVVQLICRPTKRTRAVGQITEILGKNVDITMAVNIALRTHHIPHIWPSAVECQIKGLPKEVLEEAKEGRTDLRSLPFVTIDSEDAHDFDDAVYCEGKSRGGWKLWVAIADVSYYVQPHSPLDKEANRRTTSIYFPSKVIPMLPEVLSNNICSLQPKADRLCLVCEMTISVQGRLSSYKFYEAIISSCARLTYSKVWQILQNQKNFFGHYKSFFTSLTQLYAMYRKLEKERLLRGSIFFETEDIKFVFNENQHIEQIILVSRNDAHRIIEECMILTNIAAARLIEKSKEPALYRIHDRPSYEHIILLRTELSRLGLTLGGGNKPEPKDYANLMKLIVRRPDREVLQTILMKSMQQAMYNYKNSGHFGLALQAYTHFTSPIRRYSDLILHRVIKSIIKKKNRNHEEMVSIQNEWNDKLQNMLQLGQQCSLGERRADEAVRDVVDWIKCDFMKDHVGKMFNGTIINVTSFGFFVRVHSLLIDGLVHISSLDNDYYRYDRIRQRLVGKDSGITYHLGDAVQIRVKAVHINERKIDFSLAYSHSQIRKNCKNKKFYY